MAAPIRIGTCSWADESLTRYFYPPSIKGAEERLARGRRSMAEAIEGRRPATSDDIKELRAELRAIGRRLDKIEERLPKKRTSGSASKRSGSTSARGGSTSARSGGSTKRGSKS